MDTRTVNIGQTIVHGVAFDPKNNDRVKQMDFNELVASVGHLFDLLEEREVPYVLVGGIAMLAYVEGRNTQDIDLILASSDLASLPEIALEDRNKEFARGRIGELQVDMLFTENNLFKLVAQQYATRLQFAEREIPCATQRGLILLKLFALPSLYRQGQFEKVEIYEHDVASLLRASKPETAPLLDALRPWLAASDLEEVKAIVADIEQRLAKSRDRFRDSAD